MTRIKRDNHWPSPARSRVARTLEVHRPSAALPTRTPTPRFGANFGNSAANRSTACSATELGPAMDIRRVAALIGCSPWTVRQRLIPMGLPRLQYGAAGRLIFYRDQVIRWIESKPLLSGTGVFNSRQGIGSMKVKGVFGIFRFQLSFWNANACKVVLAARSRLPTMRGEPWPDCFHSAHGASSPVRVPEVCKPVSWRSSAKELLLLGAVSGDGLRSVHLPRKSA